MIEPTCCYIDPTRRWYLWLLVCLLGVLALTLAGCSGGGGGGGDGDAGPGGSAPPMPTLQPGDTFDLGFTETLTVNGEYFLPVGATSITTRCTGEVSVTIPGSSNPGPNICRSPDGSSSQTNLVTGATSVIYDFGAEASAEVTVNGSALLKPTLQPGNILDLGFTETLTVNGEYFLPVGATSITTRCTGEVSVTIPESPNPGPNICRSPDGSSSQTNLVTGAASVIYDFGAEASAEVTVN